MRQPAGDRSDARDRNAQSVRQCLLPPQRGSQVWLLLLLIHRKDSRTPSQPPQNKDKTPYFIPTPLLKNKHSKKILSQYLQTHPLWATFSLLWRGDKMLSSDPPSWGDKGKTSERHRGLGRATVHPATWPLGAERSRWAWATVPRPEVSVKRGLRHCSPNAASLH